MLALIGFQGAHRARAKRAINAHFVAFFLQRGLYRFDGFAVYRVVAQHAFPTYLRVADFFKLGNFRVLRRNFDFALLGFFHQFFDLDGFVFRRHFDFARGFFADQFLLLHRLKLGFNLRRVQAGFFLHGLLGDGFHLCRHFDHAQRFTSGRERTRRAFAARGHVRRFGDHFFLHFGILRRHDFLRGHRRLNFDLFLNRLKNGGDDFQLFAGRLDDNLLFRPFIFGRNNLVGLGGVLDDDLLGARLEFGGDDHQRLTFARLHLRHGQGNAVAGCGSGRFGGSSGGIVLRLRQGGNCQGSQQDREFFLFHWSKSPDCESQNKEMFYAHWACQKARLL